jgi:hypothetical protein
MKSLLEFYNDSETRENVYNYLTEFLEKEALKKIFNREDTSGVAEAKEVIDKAFKEMEIMFMPKKENKKIINQSR